MADPIIPEKPNLFNSRTYKYLPPVVRRQSRPFAQVKKREAKIKEAEPVFDIPVIDQPKPAFQSPPATPMIPKTSGWRKWVVIVSGSVIVVGLGVYFLLG